MDPLRASPLLVKLRLQAADVARRRQDRPRALDEETDPDRGESPAKRARLAGDPMPRASASTSRAPSASPDPASTSAEVQTSARDETRRRAHGAPAAPGPRLTASQRQTLSRWSFKPGRPPGSSAVGLSAPSRPESAILPAGLDGVAAVGNGFQATQGPGESSGARRAGTHVNHSMAGAARTRLLESNSYTEHDAYSWEGLAVPSVSPVPLSESHDVCAMPAPLCNASAALFAESVLAKLAARDHASTHETLSDSRRGTAMAGPSISGPSRRQSLPMPRFKHAQQMSALFQADVIRQDLGMLSDAIGDQILASVAACHPSPAFQSSIADPSPPRNAPPGFQWQQTTSPQPADIEAGFPDESQPPEWCSHPLPEPMVKVELSASEELYTSAEDWGHAPVNFGGGDEQVS